MNHRKMLYGYRYQMGELTIHEREAVTVRQIVAVYLDGLSYQKIAETLNENQIPFSDENTFWNKHKIKRLLENPRYAGEDGYPPIINHEQFRAVQEKIQGKSGNRNKISSRPVLRLRPFLTCAECGKIMFMDAVGADSDYIRLKCKTCGVRLDLPDTELIRPIISQIAEKRNHSRENSYEPSKEVIRLTNAVNRALEHPDDPDQIVSLILRGVSARYDRCPNPDRESSNIRLDEQELRQEISHIAISRNSEIAVYFQSP